MLGDLLKLFTEEPDKLQRLVFGFLKAMLTIVFAAFLYKTWVGPFQENLPSSLNGWMDYFSDGHLLLYLFMLAIGYFLLFELTTGLFSLLILVLGLLVRKIFKFKDDDQRLALKLFDVLRFNKAGTDIRPGSNIEILYDISKTFESPGEKELATIIDKSTYTDIRNIYITFAVIYFTALKDLSGFNNISWLVIITGGLITLATITLDNVVKYMQQNCKDLLAGLSFVKYEQCLKRYFKSWA
jgi:ABC-type multidrug transport system fused ATPase/permease subunit